MKKCNQLISYEHISENDSKLSYESPIENEIELELDEEDNEIELELDEEDNEIELEDDDDLNEYGYKELLYKNLNKILYPDATDCPITCEDFDEDDVIIITSCKHIFLRENLENWFKDHNSCPMCRKNIMNPVKNKDNNEKNPEYSNRGINIFAANYNIIRMMNGMSGLAFSN